MDKLKMHSPDGVAANIERLAELFPGCVTETRDEQGQLKRGIDFDLLRQELSDHLVEGPQERYRLDWPGKREALLAANAPIAKTLRPCREESVDFDISQNLFIEGDNLEALKLLQETYLGKVKMIYIDPPYNTGGDFVYDDNFGENSSDYLIRSNQVIGDRPVVALTESSGRRHSEWLSTMLARLRIARGLLRQDGVILVSIEDTEVANLRRVLDEVFGEENFVGCVVWKNATDNNPTNIATEHEYILVFSRSKAELEPVWRSGASEIKRILVEKGRELIGKRLDDDSLQKEYTEWFRAHKSELGPLEGYKYIDQKGVYAGIRGVHNPGKEGYRYDVLHPETGEPCKQPLMGYRFPEATMKSLLGEGKIIFGDDHTKLIELKAYAHEYEDKLSSVLELDGRSGAYDLRALFPELRTAFTNPKPVRLLQQLIGLVCKNHSDIVMDFFAGSGTTGQATLEASLRDGIRRRYILVQAPERSDLKSEAAKGGFEFISEIARERLRRASSFYSQRTENLDTGYRAFFVDTSNMADVHYRPDQLQQADLLGMVENIRPDRSAEDLLFQVLLDWGVDLGLPIRREDIAGREVFFVDGNALAACFVADGSVDEAFVRELAQRQPLRAVFRDRGFAGDNARINAEQIFKALSPNTDVRTL